MVPFAIMVRGGLLLFALQCLSALLCGYGAMAQRVAIGLYDNVDLQAVAVSPESRGYRLVLDGQVRPLPTGQLLRAKREGAALSVSINGQPLGNYHHVALVNDEIVARISVRSEGNGGEKRVLEGNLSLTVDFQRVMCINLVDQECYVAGVVQAEVGRGQHVELYKAQSLLVRTYLIAHRGRHAAEGFNLCDQVHCQAYINSAWDNECIRGAALATKGMVVVDGDGRLITSVFHANCGGQTASAEQVWLTPLSYLRGRVDPDCVGKSGARWTAVVPLAEWKRFLSSKGIPTVQLTDQQMAYRSSKRELLYSLPGGWGVPFRDLREYFNLRSAWFDVEVRGGEVHLLGRGYGHGIGMCQQGAMEKARKGYTAEQILQAYFQGVSVVSVERALPMASPDVE